MFPLAEDFCREIVIAICMTSSARTAALALLVEALLSDVHLNSILLDEHT